MAFSRKSVYALVLCANTALGSPLIAEPLSSIDISLQLRSSSPTCPSSYESNNGLKFSTYCEKNNPWNDAIDPPVEAASMSDCMERCSRYWGDKEGCYGIVYRVSDQQCWIKNSTINTNTSAFADDPATHTALVNATQLQALDDACPSADLSTHTVNGTTGVGYTTHCGKVINGFDTCWGGYEGCLPQPFVGYYHAESLETCLGFCVDEHPLCRAVSFNPRMEIGFANCWPKTGFSDAAVIDPPANQGVMHSATITSLDTVDTECPGDATYAAAANQKVFNLHCGQLNEGQNITSLHMRNVTACMDACAASTSGCVGVVFDSGLLGGYKNCYLQNTTSVITDQASATYALLSDTAAPTSAAPGSSDSPSPKTKKSKAWIAGPVVGGLAALFLLGALLFRYQTRKRDAKHTADVGNGDVKPYNNPAPPSELGRSRIQDTQEMEAKPTTKYAHGGEEQAPQELPTTEGALAGARQNPQELPT
ncbi:hypothetical protein K458DRAFT_338731 [Lentithecium fluviatile CBS 122367]|uniref:Apple domain-containing protein n=1 Tax=Lentithecium fluviatile CBS 122367 TaxID=1168545 RepID=A0A6G1J2X3_9PLEO|nr:hypothetical protein K458DRAFT_338731 [Lentithecium fluviatile CBS 122367]